MNDMITVSRSEIEANLDLLIYEHTGFNVNQHYDQEMIKSMKNLVNAILDKAEKSQVEPVGYISEQGLKDLKKGFYGVSIFEYSNLRKVPVYTSPPADKQDAERYRWLKLQNADLDNDS